MKENMSDVHYSSLISKLLIEKSDFNADILGEAIEAFKKTYSILNKSL